MRTGLSCLLLVIATTLSGCGGSSPSGAATTPTPNTWLLADLPDGALPVAAVKATAREGDHVVVRGRIGGRVDPLSHDVAVFIVVDPVLPSCKAMGDDCKTPWDYCCETPETITANSATVQLVDNNNSALAIDLTTHGFELLDEVVVVGTVGPRPNDAALVIRAHGIHRVTG
jgi:hypothetical protein